MEFHAVIGNFSFSAFSQLKEQLSICRIRSVATLQYHNGTDHSIPIQTMFTLLTSKLSDRFERIFQTMNFSTLSVFLRYVRAIISFRKDNSGIPRHDSLFLFHHLFTLECESQRFTYCAEMAMMMAVDLVMPRAQIFCNRLPDGY
jgi:hypothetical protein